MSERPQITRASDERAAERPLSGSVGLGRRSARGREASPHSAKFRAVTAALVGLGIGAIIVAVTALSGSSKTGPSQPWSAWRPPDNGSLGAREIADHLAPFYRISGVDQLAVVTVTNVSTPDPNATTTTSQNSGVQVAVRTDPTSSAVSVLSGATIAFNLCGIGSTNCAISVGQPSTARLLLLRREALELALYTFKYISGVQNVVAILPPGHTSTTQTSRLSPKPPSSNAASSTKPVDIALLFVHDELQPWLSQPLSSTFPEPFPPTVATVASAPEASLVDQLTARGLFSERLVQAQDGSNLIVLDPLPPQ
jgi:hypothetical protein